MNINWYPGHMKKTLENISAQLKTIDFVIVLLDARIPISSQNPALLEILEDKPKLILLNKADLADPQETKAWIDALRTEHQIAMEWTAVSNESISKIIRHADLLMEDKLERNRQRGIQNYKYRAMIVGIPNVGKSTFINQLSNRKGAKVGNKPGITKQNQWIKVNKDIDFLDTPGVLWPKLDPPIRGRHLAYTGSIKDEIMDIETLAFEFLKEGLERFPEYLFDRYKITDFNGDALALMEEIGRKRGAIIRGGEVDYTQVAKIILTDYRNGRMGRLTLEKAGDQIE